MEQSIHQVVVAIRKTKELNVHHVRQPRHGVPVARVKRTKGPKAPFTCETLLDNRVYTDIVAVVEGNQLMTGDWQEQQKRQREKEKRNEKYRGEDSQLANAPYERCENAVPFRGGRHILR